MKLLISFSILWVAGLAVGWWQHVEIANLRGHIALRRDSVEREDVRPKTPNFTSSAQLAETNDLAAFRGEHEDLLKLRGQVSLLRKAPAQSVAQLQQQLTSLQAELEAQLRTKDFTKASYQADVVSKVTRETLRFFVVTLQGCAKVNDGRLPQSLEEVKRIADAVPQGNNLRRALEYALGAEFEGISWKTFEFIPQPRPLTPADRDAFILRERQPRHMPDGTVVRAYANANGAVQELPEP